ncbi:MAG: hypothetical protein GY790_12875 [Bacteroidetes bacterium]|nr:hypothetical protein [Bacteroidota bacterium]
MKSIRNFFMFIVLISVTETYNTQVLASALDELKVEKAIWREKVAQFKCASVTPSKRKCEPNGDIGEANDSVLFNALLCASGELFACDAVKRSQEDSGRWRRSPLHVDGEVIAGSGSFSKDQVVGLLLWAISTPEKEDAKYRLNKWLQWAKDNNSPMGYTQKISTSLYNDLVEGGLESMVQKKCSGGEANVWADAWKCLTGIVGHFWEHHIDLPMVAVCEQTHCTLTPALYNLMYYVWEYLGDTPSYSNPLLFQPATHPNMKFFYDTYDGVKATLDAAKDLKGQERYLQVVKAIIYDKLGENVSEVFEHVKSKEPNNPHYQFLEGNTSHEDIANNLLQTCAYVSQSNYLTDNPGNQWTWQRDEEKKTDWEAPMGWDCIFTANLLGVPERSVYVDKENCTSDEEADGTMLNPYCTVGKAVELVDPGGTLFIQAGDYWENITISKPMHLESQGGIVRIISQ